MPTTTGTATSFITFTRASTATRFNASGFVESVASGTARLDYDPVTLAPRGLLIEEQRTNLLLQSGTLTSASWSKVASSAAASALVSPSGAADAFKLTEDTSSNFHAVDQSITFTAASYTYWAIVKKTERDFILLQENSSGAARRSWFNIANGTLGTVGAGHTAAIRSFGNGWYHCSVTFTGTALATIVRLGAATANGVAIYLGDGASGVAVYAQQCELGAFPTSYIPTTSATVSRSADVASVPTSAFPYSATEGTLISRFAMLGYNGNNVSAALQDSAASTNLVYHTALSAISVTSQVFSAGTAVHSGSATIVAGSEVKMATAYKQNDFGTSVNGAAATVTSSGNVPVGMDTLYLGKASTATRFLNGHLKSVAYIPRRLTNAELQARTV